MAVTRFAPSPTGRLHLGHGYAAWFAREAAGRDGRLLLRIEDIDGSRCRAKFAEGIVEDLEWLGVRWVGAPRLQSAHLPQYRAVLERLRGEGLIYPCFCTRADVAAAGLAPHDPYGQAVYPGTCQGRGDAADLVAAGVAHAWRLDMAAALRRVGALTFHDRGVGVVACDAGRFGDVVLGRKDAPASYHLCATHDDAVQGVSLVTRGEDLLAATDVQRVLQALLGWPEPDYHHHRLVRDAAGRRLAKRDAGVTIAGLRAAGMSARDVQRLWETGGTERHEPA